MLSGLCPCPCLTGSLYHLLIPSVLPCSLPAPTCLFCWAALSLPEPSLPMHILLELPRNLYPPEDTSVQRCESSSSLVLNPGHLRRGSHRLLGFPGSAPGTLLHLTFILGPFCSVSHFSTPWLVFLETLSSKPLSDKSSSQGLFLENQNEDWEQQLIILTS